MNLPTVKQLKYLSELAEHRHFGRAAQACFVSQSALSTAIHELEHNLGVSLFERGSSIFLTPIGNKLVTEARDILNRLDNFTEHAKQAQGNFKSDLRFGSFQRLHRFYYLRYLRRCIKSTPTINCISEKDLSPNLIEMLNKGQLDVLLFALPYDTGGLHTEALFSDELVLCLPRDHQLSEKQAISIADLKRQDILLLEDGHCLRDQSLKACNLEPNNLSIPYQATSLNTLVQMVVNNIGITLLPEMAVSANITHDTDAKIRHIDTKRDMSRTIALVWRKNSPRADEFKELGTIISELHS